MEQQKAYRSLQIKGTNSSSLAMDYVIFALYEKNSHKHITDGRMHLAMVREDFDTGDTELAILSFLDFF